jgi:drug/metabolite transporter (DMT)-like permease
MRHLSIPTSNTRSAALLKALLAAVLFGASAPLAKALLQDVQPVPLAAFLYLGCGAGALIFRLVQRAVTSRELEAPLALPDLPWLGGALLAGGVAAPIILMVSLQATPAGTASLLLNFEGVSTALIAGLIFREAIGRSAWLAIGLVTLGSILLSWNPTGWGFSVGALGVLAACIFWGLDNNFTRHISAKNPLSIVAIKGLGAGTVSLLLALTLRQPLPALLPALLAMLLGSISYGLSIVLFVMAMRDLGAARTSALYATAPFLGMLLSVAMFGERPSLTFLLAIPLMAAGAFLLLREDHRHFHQHAPLGHEHSHTHDDAHHEHDHAPGETASMGRHSHAHRHEPEAHAHPHAPDLHHRHEHQEACQ